MPYRSCGGARSYMQDGKMTGGFAVLACPAGYRSSGVMTFMVGQDGVVYQKDLGPRTITIVPAIKSYDPDQTLGSAFSRRKKTRIPQPNRDEAIAFGA
jgi:hypothetical protein